MTNKYLDKIYQEEDDSEFTSNGKRYNLNKVLRDNAHVPITQIPVKDLKWVLKYDKANSERVKKADITTPLLVTKWQGKYVAVDGLHRLTKAVQRGVEMVPCKLISLD